MWHCVVFPPSLLYTVFQQDPGYWRSRVCVMPCCSIFSSIRGFSFQPQPRTRWPPRSSPPHPLLPLSLLCHTLRWTMFFFCPLTEIVTSLIEFHVLSFSTFQIHQYYSKWCYHSTYQQTQLFYLEGHSYANLWTHVLYTGYLQVLNILYFIFFICSCGLSGDIIHL